MNDQKYYCADCKKEREVKIRPFGIYCPHCLAKKELELKKQLGETKIDEHGRSL